MIACLLSALVVPAAAVPSPAMAARRSINAVFAGTALWVREIAPGQNGQDLVGEAARGGVHTLYVKAGDGIVAEPQFSSALVSEMQAAGASVCAWTFMYGSNPTAEAAVAAASVLAGAQCLIVDAEGASAPVNLYGAAQLFVRALRSQLGPSFPIALASQAEVGEHPTFPYSVFLAPGAFDVVMPLIYWLDFGQSVDSAYAATMGANAIYGRPVLPVGQLYGGPALGELASFRALAGAYGAPGLSFFDLDSAQPEELIALAAPPLKLAREPLLAPTMHPGADGDQIVWAQELLNAAGARLPVGGYYGAETDRAVASFQARHDLRPTGIITPSTWQALSRFRPHEPSWIKGPPDSAR
jgi:hypothetical protein